MPKNLWVQLSQGQRYSYTIVRSARAKYIRLKLSNVGILTLVVPNRANLKQGHKFIQSKAVWIEKQLANIDIYSDELPEILSLKLLNEQWNILYSEEDIQHLYLNEVDNNTLTISGAISNKTLVKKMINKWCQYKAKQVFSNMLNDLATEYGFKYKKLTVRSQKTRWGSCSQDKSINLNSKLLFFNEYLVRHVMIHELCHTIEMNHSKNFWKLVKDCDPEYLTNKSLLKTLDKKIHL